MNSTTTRTRLYFILNERTLQTATDENGQIMLFNTEAEANFWASSRLDLWQTYLMHFLHESLQYEPSELS